MSPSPLLSEGSGEALHVTNATGGSQDSTNCCQYSVDDNAPILFRLFTHNCLIRNQAPSFVNGLYPPLGLPVSGEQKRLSTYWSARVQKPCLLRNQISCHLSLLSLWGTCTFLYIKQLMLKQESCFGKNRKNLLYPIQRLRKLFFVRKRIIYIIIFLISFISI